MIHHMIEIDVIVKKYLKFPGIHVLSGINVQDTGSNSADNIAGVYYRPVQKYINGTWYNVASV